MVEADGVMLSLQREKERKAEVKLGIAYEGWEKIGKDRYKTGNKTVFEQYICFVAAEPLHLLALQHRCAAVVEGVGQRRAGMYPM